MELDGIPFLTADPILNPMLPSSPFFTFPLSLSFNRYLDYEREFGDEESVDAVKRKAMEFVQSAVAGTQGGVGDDE